MQTVGYDAQAPFRRIGYARVSTVGQTLESQVEQLKAAGCRVIHKEKITGTRADRKELNRLLKARLDPVINW